MPLAFATIFVAFVAGSAWAGKLPALVLALYLGGSLVAFTVYALDKSAARNGRWRTRESTLHLLGLIGGWPGALIAQQLLRHKSQKRPFQLFFWSTVLLNCSALLYLLA
jgi:uncharacterized membrane protein YsdA (DUF1294 family)